MNILLQGMSYILRLVMRWISRLYPHMLNRAPPMTPKILLDMFHVLDHQDSLECSVFAAGLFLFFTMSRLGSFLPASSKTPSQCFLTKDRVNACDAGLILTLLQTKTIQFGERILHMPLIHTDSPLCPVAAYTHAAGLVGDISLVPAFNFRKADGSVCTLTVSGFVDTFRSLLTCAGREDAMTFRGHSFRRGASWGFNNGVPGS